MPEHITELKNGIRDADRKEIEVCGISVSKAIWRSYKMAIFSRSAFVDGKIIASWGCGGTFMGDVGRPWLLTSNDIYKISPMKFSRLYRKEVLEMLDLFPNLEGYVHSEYDGAVRILKICGFQIADPIKIGQGMFNKFIMKRSGVWNGD